MQQKKNGFTPTRGSYHFRYVWWVRLAFGRSWLALKKIRHGLWEGSQQSPFPLCWARLTSLPKMVSGFNHFQWSYFDEDECDLLKAVNIGKVILALAGVTIVQSLMGPPWEIFNIMELLEMGTLCLIRKCHWDKCCHQTRDWRH